MALREFRDDHGVQWQVWDTQPTLRIFGEAAAATHLHEDAANGWLTFQSSRERRRFFQVPPEWETMPDDELRRLCRHAVPVETTRP
jgi:hypothetical protein